MIVSATEIADALVAAMVALSFPNTDVAKRKTPTLPKPLTAGRKAIIVSIGEEGKHERITDRKWSVRYPAAVTIVSTGGQHTADDEAVRSMRATIIALLQTYSTFQNVTEFNDVELGGGPPFDRTALDAALNYSIVTATVEVLENRQ